MAHDADQHTVLTTNLPVTSEHILCPCLMLYRIFHKINCAVGSGSLQSWHCLVRALIIDIGAPNHPRAAGMSGGRSGYSRPLGGSPVGEVLWNGGAG